MMTAKIEAPLTEEEPHSARRAFLRNSLMVTAGVASMGSLGMARLAVAEPLTQRYPDELVEILDESFAKYRLFNASVERLADGMRWAEGPVWVGDGRYLLVSDIPENRIMRWDEITGSFDVYRNPSNHSNGLARDLQGRLLVCEGSTTNGQGRRVTRTEPDGSITVLASEFEGKRFNSPNDLAVRQDGSIWFSDPPFQTGNFYEGHKIETELQDGVYRIDGESGAVTRVIDSISGPNGLCFAPDQKTLYIVEGRAKPNRLVWAYPVNDDGTLGERRKHIEAPTHGALDGIKCDEDGNLWCGWGSSGAPEANTAELDGVMIFNPAGKAIGKIRLPERCANLCFGGAKGNRLFMASSHSLYALYVNTRDANFGRYGS